MKDFLACFFGAETTEEFRIFTFAHLTPILAMASVIPFLYFVAYLPWLLKDRKAKKVEVSLWFILLPLPA